MKVGMMRKTQGAEVFLAAKMLKCLWVFSIRKLVKSLQKEIQQKVQQCTQMSQQEWNVINPKFVANENGKGETLKTGDVAKEDAFQRDLRNQMEILSKAGFEINTAEDTLGAVTKYQAFNPALIVLDVDMPAGGGRKVFERLRLQLASATPILFSTASPDSVADLAKNLNVTVLTKPVTPAILLAAVKKLLKLP